MAKGSEFYFLSAEARFARWNCGVTGRFPFASGCNPYVANLTMVMWNLRFHLGVGGGCRTRSVIYPTRFIR